VFVINDIRPYTINVLKHYIENERLEGNEKSLLDPVKPLIGQIGMLLLLI